MSRLLAAPLILMGSLVFGCTVSNTVIQMAEAPDAGVFDGPIATPDLGPMVDAGQAPDVLSIASDVALVDMAQPSGSTDAELARTDAETQRCGDGVCRAGETQVTCCSDCGCAAGALCHQNACIAPTQLSAGGSHSCVVIDDGTALCWGGNEFGELGIGSASTSGTPTAKPVVALTGAKSIAAGGTFTCALLVDQTVKCWGRNKEGQLGNGTNNTSFIPVPVSNLTAVVALSAGYDYACAVLEGDTAKCWGNNSSGQLGDGSTTSSSLPVDVQGITNVAGIAAGFNATCVRLSTDGSARCWGDNKYGQLGNGTGANSISPVKVIGLTTAVAIDAFYSAMPDFVDMDKYGSFCAVLADGTLKCWGSNNLGELGISGDPQPRPMAVPGVSGVHQVVGGKHFACALTDESVACWGSNVAGQLGSATVDSMSRPLTVSGLGPVKSIAAGSQHVCALLADASVVCWGSNLENQLGNDAMTTSTKPVPVFR